MENVIDVAVFGLPNDQVQELVTALVVKKSDSQMTSQEIVDFVTKSQLGDAKKLRGGVKFVDHLPKSQQGKLLRRQLLKFYQEVE